MHRTGCYPTVHHASRKLVLFSPLNWMARGWEYEYVSTLKKQKQKKTAFILIRNIGELTFKRTDCKAVSGTNGSKLSQVQFFTGERR